MEFTIRMDGAEETFTAESEAEAREYAEKWLSEGDWDTTNGYVYVDGWLFDGESFEEYITAVIPQPEPPCDQDEHEHDWQSPHDIVGGSRDNPGVWGSRGGVLIKECCMNCGCLRKTDTGAQRRDTGASGVTEVTYERKYYVLSERANEAA